MGLGDRITTGLLILGGGLVGLGLAGKVILFIILLFGGFNG